MKVVLWLDCYPYDEKAMVYNRVSRTFTVLDSCEPTDSGIKSLDEFRDCLELLQQQSSLYEIADKQGNKYCISRVSVVARDGVIEVWCEAHLMMR